MKYEFSNYITNKSNFNPLVRKIANSIVQLGWINPIVVDGRSKIIAGHARFEAAKLLGLRRVPVIRVEHLNDRQVRAYALADNKLAEDAGWDREALAVEFEELQIELPQIGLDLDITGFEPGEVDAILMDLGSESADPADEDAQPTNEPIVSQAGDLFVLGQHRLVVGDARQPDVYERLMAGELAEMGFCDPPYNVKVAGWSVAVRRSIASLPVLRASYHRRSSSTFSNRRSAYVRAMRSMAASTSRVPTGGTSRRCSKLARPYSRS